MNPEKAAAFYERWLDHTKRGFTAGLRGDERLAEELTQELLLRICLRALPPHDPKAYIDKAIRNEIAGEYRRRRARPQVAIDDDVPSTRSTENAALARIFLGRLRAVLTPLEWRTLTLSLRGYSPTEIAGMTGENPPTVESNLKRAKRKARAEGARP